MDGRRKIRKKRRRIFVACEGETERSYVRFIGSLAETVGIFVHFDAHVCGGGDHLVTIQTAITIMEQQIKNRGGYWKRAIFLDSDLRQNIPSNRTLLADNLIKEQGFLAVWSNPCIEALILRHNRGCETLSPSTTQDAERQLKIRWPEYSKPSSADELRRRFDLSSVRRAATQDTELRFFLEEVGFPDGRNGQ